MKTNYKRATGVFKSREDIENALRALKDNGFNMDNVSLLARDLEGVESADEVTEQHGNEASEGAGIGATTGTVLGGIGGFLVGAGVLAIPGVGPVLAAGVGISEIAATLAGAGIGAAAGGIVGALVGLGIPEEKAKVYEDRIKAGDYLLMVTGTENEVESAASILRDRHIQEFEIYDARDLDNQDREVVNDNRPMASRNEVVTERRETVTREDATKKIDIDNDNEAEVFIVDKTQKDL
ncbi:glycine zipper family protein [Myxosarcina sp. GI1]|uniref:glycine zipper family protein n=1 Tax=Myxosarcina sp. GI1 TaxID=1541065 RepID=UPI000560F6CE|nr:glycine zipper family protein [Myxosarcina sp. GI1]